ncbi:oxidoreductase [Paraburkholderia sp. SG-MS1]|uniref:oxidoreductase n=1 Tax=Paraburkholderia sp. SG-MS1 TaxID=2023741 RepID=UPI003139CB09
MSVLTQVSPSTALPHAVSTPRPSACPGLLRIVAARDGGICRIKLPGGELSADEARAIADASTRHAAGVIELTNRANLQLRGVRPGHEAELIAALVEAGLGPMKKPRADAIAANAVDAAGISDTVPASVADLADAAARTDASNAAAVSAADDVRNVMISPAAGRDPFALIDTAALCAELLTLLQRETRFTALSPKFALLLDGGERLAKIDHPHDVWLAATSSRDGVRFVFGLAGCPCVEVEEDANAVTDDDAGAGAGAGAKANAGTNARTHAAAAGVLAAHPLPATLTGSTVTRNSRTRSTHTHDHRPLATVLPSQVPALVRALLHTFLDLAPADALRMRDLLATHGADALLQHAQRYADFPLSRDAQLTEWRRSTTADAALRLGAHAQREAGLWHVGGQPPLGRLDAATLHGLAALAQRHGNGTLRATPWQSVLLPDIPTHALPAALAELNGLGLASDPAQPITRLIACAGSSGCAKSLADTKADALRLAALLPANVDVHLSGCTRSCAAAHCAPYTLLAAARGLYDLYRRNGDAGFGHCVAHQLTIAQAADLLAHLSRSDTDA